MVAAATMNMLSTSKTKQVEPQDLIARRRARPKVQDWEAQLLQVEMLNRLFGGRDLRN